MSGVAVALFQGSAEGSRPGTRPGSRAAAPCRRRHQLRRRLAATPRLAACCAAGLSFFAPRVPALLRVSLPPAACCIAGSYQLLGPSRCSPGPVCSCLPRQGPACPAVLPTFCSPPPELLPHLPCCTLLPWLSPTHNAFPLSCPLLAARLCSRSVSRRRPAANPCPDCPFAPPPPLRDARLTFWPACSPCSSLFPRPACCAQVEPFFMPTRHPACRVPWALSPTCLQIYLAEPRTVCREDGGQGREMGGVRKAGSSEPKKVCPGAPGCSMHFCIPKISGSLQAMQNLVSPTCSTTLNTNQWSCSEGSQGIWLRACRGGCPLRL